MDKIKAKVTFVIDPDNFWAQVGADATFKVFSSYLNSLRTKLGAKKLVRDCMGEGNLLLRSPSAGEWRRAEVVRVSSDLIDVFYTDHGTTELINLTHECHVLPNHLALPTLAQCCRLAGIKSIAQWTTRAIKRFEQLTLNQTLDVDVVKSQENETHLLIYDSTGVSVTQTLLDEEFGIPMSLPGCIPSHPPKFTHPGNGGPPREYADSPTVYEVATVPAGGDASSGSQVLRVPSFDMNEIAKAHGMTAEKLAERVTVQQQEHARENAVSNMERMMEELLAERRMYVGNDSSSHCDGSPTSPEPPKEETKAVLSKRELAIQKMISQPPLPLSQLRTQSPLGVDVKVTQHSPPLASKQRTLSKLTGQGNTRVNKSPLRIQERSLAMRGSPSTSADTLKVEKHRPLDAHIQIRVQKVISEMTTTGRPYIHSIEEKLYKGIGHSSEAVTQFILERLLTQAIEKKAFTSVAIEVLGHMKEKPGFVACISTVMWQLQDTFIQLNAVQHNKVAYCQMIALMFKTAVNWPESCADPVRICVVNTLQKWIRFDPRRVPQTEQKDGVLMEAMYTDCFLSLSRAVVDSMKSVMLPDWSNIMDGLCSKVADSKTSELIRNGLLKFVVSLSLRGSPAVGNDVAVQTDRCPTREVGCNTDNTTQGGNCPLVITQTYNGASVQRVPVVRPNDLSPSHRLSTPREFNVSPATQSDNNLSSLPHPPRFIQPLMPQSHVYPIPRYPVTQNQPMPNAFQHGFVPFSPGGHTNVHGANAQPKLPNIARVEPNVQPARYVAPQQFARVAPQMHHVHSTTAQVTGGQAQPIMPRWNIPFNPPVNLPPDCPPKTMYVLPTGQQNRPFYPTNQGHATTSSPRPNAPDELHQTRQCNNIAAFLSMNSESTGQLLTQESGEGTRGSQNTAATPVASHQQLPINIKQQMLPMNITNELGARPINEHSLSAPPRVPITKMNIPVTEGVVSNDPQCQSVYTHPGVQIPRNDIHEKLTNFGDPVDAVDHRYDSPPADEIWSSDDGDDNYYIDTAHATKPDIQGAYLSNHRSNEVREPVLKPGDTRNTPKEQSVDTADSDTFMNGLNSSAYLNFDDIRERMADQILREFRERSSAGYNEDDKNQAIGNEINVSESGEGNGKDENVSDGKFRQLHLPNYRAIAEQPGHLEGVHAQTSASGEDGHTLNDGQHSCDPAMRSGGRRVLGCSVTDVDDSMVSRTGLDTQLNPASVVQEATFMLKSKKHNGDEFVGKRTKKAAKDRPTRWKAVISDIIRSNDQPARYDPIKGQIEIRDQNEERGDDSDEFSAPVDHRRSPPTFVFGPRKCAICGELNHTTTECYKRENFFI